jgi:hypothetical protein
MARRTTEVELEVREAAGLALALLRDEQANGLLVSLVAQAPTRTAVEAVHALRLFRGDQRMSLRVLDAARDRDDEAVAAEAERSFS